MTITSHENIREDYLRLNIQTNDKPCGSLDFIADKINFNISCKNDFFKGMESIGNITIEYKDDRLLFIFKDKQKVSFECNPKAFEQISNHIKCYANIDKSQSIKNGFFNN